jgi:hypothetical protein
MGWSSSGPWTIDLTHPRHQRFQTIGTLNTFMQAFPEWWNLELPFTSHAEF